MTDTIEGAADGVDIGGLLASQGHVSTSWSELGEWTQPNGVAVSRYHIGDPADEASPTVFKVYFPPECRIEPHTHACAYSEIILEGSQKVSGTWYHAGDIRIAVADKAYGPLIAGPEGATVLVIFENGHWPAIPLGGKHDGSTLFNAETVTRTG